MIKQIAVLSLILAQPLMAQEIDSDDPLLELADRCLSNAIAGDPTQAACLDELQEDCETLPLPGGLTNCLEYETRVWQSLLQSEIQRTRSQLQYVEIEGRDIIAEFDSEQSAWEIWSGQSCDLFGTVSVQFNNLDTTDYCVLFVLKERAEAVRRLVW